MNDQRIAEKPQPPSNLNKKQLHTSGRSPKPTSRKNYLQIVRGCAGASDTAGLRGNTQFLPRVEWTAKTPHTQSCLRQCWALLSAAVSSLRQQTVSLIGNQELKNSCREKLKTWRWQKCPYRRQWSVGQSWRKTHRNSCPATRFGANPFCKTFGLAA